MASAHVCLAVGVSTSTWLSGCAGVCAGLGTRVCAGLGTRVCARVQSPGRLRGMRVQTRICSRARDSSLWTPPVIRGISGTPGASRRKRLPVRRNRPQARGMSGGPDGRGEHGAGQAATCAKGRIPFLFGWRTHSPFRSDGTRVLSLSVSSPLPSTPRVGAKDEITLSFGCRTGLDEVACPVSSGFK